MVDCVSMARMRGGGGVFVGRGGNLALQSFLWNCQKKAIFCNDFNFVIVSKNFLVLCVSFFFRVCFLSFVVPFVLPFFVCVYCYIYKYSFFRPFWAFWGVLFMIIYKYIFIVFFALCTCPLCVCFGRKKKL